MTAIGYEILDSSIATKPELDSLAERLRLEILAREALEKRVYMLERYNGNRYSTIRRTHIH